MSRPKPLVILEKHNPKSYKTDQVVSSEGIWAVFYNNNPINIKSFNSLVSYPGPKYKKCSHSNSGFTINLCKKLNEEFKTDKFTVVLLQSGPQVYP